MIAQFLRQNQPLLTLQLRQSLVIRYQKQKSIFDTTSYNPKWIPRQKPFPKDRKPRLPIWSDPNTVGPYLIPPIRKNMSHYKSYVKNVLEKQMRQKLDDIKQYQLQPIRAGDIVDITYQETYERQATAIHRGFVLSFKRRNQLSAAIEMMVRFGGINIKAIYLIHSPKIKNIVLVSRGSGNLRASLKHNWQKMGKNQAARPLVKNRVMKKREGEKKKIKTKNYSAIQYDQIQSDNVKRIINKL